MNRTGAGGIEGVTCAAAETAPGPEVTMMKCVYVAAVLAMGAGMVSGAEPPEPAAQAAETPTTFTVGDAGRRFDSATARGGYLAVHFLLNDECPYCGRLVREYTDKGPTLAGVRHIFVQHVGEAAFAETLAAAPDPSTPLYRDVGGALAERFKIDGGYAFHGMMMTYPALVLLDPAGREVFRQIGKDNADRVPFATLVEKVESLRRDAGLSHHNLEKGLAIQGYDPVAYLDEGKATAGDAKIVSRYRGATYRFATAIHRERFNADPEKYIPAYGGWCATAMAEGKKVEINPRSFKVVNGRTLLFYKATWGDALKDWNKDEAGLKPRADAAWEKVVGGR